MKLNIGLQYHCNNATMQSKQKNAPFTCQTGPTHQKSIYIPFLFMDITSRQIGASYIDLCFQHIFGHLRVVCTTNSIEPNLDKSSGIIKQLKEK